MALLWRKSLLLLSSSVKSLRTSQGICKPLQNTNLQSRLLSMFGPPAISLNDKKVFEVTTSNAAQFLDRYDTILLDCDGVLWGTDHITPIPGIAQTINALQKLGKRICYVTNNSMHCRDKYIVKFRETGFDARPEDVFCVAYAAAVFLRKIVGVSSSVYVVGSDGMDKELDLANIEHFGVGTDPDPFSKNVEDFLRMEFRDNVGAVLVGYDPNFDMNKLYKASSYLSHPDCLFVATNDVEKSVFIGPNRLQPITGSIVDAVKSSSKRSPIVVGKPHAHLFECLKAVHCDIDTSRTIMIGDCISSDIGFAKTAGIDSGLVLTGKASLEDFENFPGLEPTYFLQSLNVLRRV